MKTEITLELKARYMMLYWGQEVWQERNYNYCISLNDDKTGKDGHLSLRSLYSLTDEEKIFIQSFFPYQGKLNHLIEMICLNEWVKSFDIDGNMRPIDTEDFLNLFDYLRSISIALPYMGIPVDEWVKAGVIVIRKEGE